MKTYGRSLKTPVSARDQSLPEEYENACRLCLTNDNVTINIHNDDVVPISLKLRYCIAIEVTEDDGLPNSLCSDCMSQLDQAYAFKKRCIATDVKLRQFIKVPSFSYSESSDCNLQETTLSEIAENSRSKDACTIKIEDSCYVYSGDFSRNTSKNTVENDLEDYSLDLENEMIEHCVPRDENGIGCIVSESNVLKEENSEANSRNNRHDKDVEIQGLCEENFEAIEKTRGSSRIMVTRKRKLLPISVDHDKSTSSGVKTLEPSEEEIFLLPAKKMYFEKI